MSTPSQRLKELGLTLPPVTRPVAAYVPCLRHQDTLLLSGQITLVDGKVAVAGKVGGDLTLEQGQHAARICCLNALGIAADAAGGIDKIVRVLRVVVYVASAPGFTQQHLVANGASELLKAVFGEAGQHTRAAVGVAELPLGSAVEIDVLFQV
jgi:enamine deaminase RidA (YjgF/YER057c/UK114 family)